MKKIKVLALTLSFVMMLSTSSCLSWDDNKESSETQKREEEKKEDEDDNSSSKEEKEGIGIPQMVLASDGDVVSENTPYFSATPISIYEPQPGESFYIQSSAATEDRIYVLITISNDEEINAFFEQIADKGWTPEMEEMYIEMDRQYRRTELFILDTEGQVKTSINLRSIMPEEMQYVDVVRATEDGKLFIVGDGIYDEETYTSQKIIIKMDEDGNLDGEPIIITPESEKAGMTKNYNSLTWDNSDNLFATGYQYPENGGEGKGFIDVLDPQGKLLFTLEDKSSDWEKGWQFADAIFVDKDTVYTAINHFNDTGNALAVIDMNEQELGEEIRVDISNFWQATIKDRKIYSADSSGLLSFNFENKKTEPIFFWKDLDDVFSSNLSTPLVLSNDIVFLSVDSFDQKTGESKPSWYLLKREKTNPNAGKKIIQLGGYYIGSDPNLVESIKKFNLSNKDYRAEILDYALINEIKEKTDYEEMEKAINMMILSGEIPDILIGSPYNTNFPLCASKDLFADLNTFIEKDDSFRKEDYVDLMFTLPSIDDKLYYTFASFHLEGLIAKKDILEGKTGWTLDELESLIDSSGKEQTIFEETSYSSLMYRLLMPSLSSIVDVVSKKADFDSDYFKKILKFCEKYGIPEAQIENRRMTAGMAMQEWVDPMEQIRDEKIPFSFSSAYSMEEWKRNWNLAGSDITVVGIPGENENNIICYPENFIAISKDRQNQDIAWEIVKDLLSLDGQKEAYSFPVLNEAFELLVAENQKPETDSYLAGMQEYAPLSDAGAQELREIIQRTTKLSTYDAQILNIIVEESEAFFAGQKDIDATVHVIQNRVMTYLNQL